ncbi:DNA-binding protein [Pseudomonas putida]|uniref:DNA-binding protein n=1 Tax=Pseudomonas putida group TaxID=136845 RepID=UPI0018AA9B52|nr:MULTISPECIES: DNA-binding protein [Pseudomonas putida group]MBF8766696.1 DNA-binding protein [Pseudomonas putida]MEC4022552.1 DNA-binding protein [Pseudomonas fulva]
MPALLIPEQVRTNGPITAAQARAELDRKGMSIAEFCRVNGLNKNLVSDLLNGRRKGRRGEAHRAAVLLGIKDGVIEG